MEGKEGETKTQAALKEKARELLTKGKGKPKADSKKRGREEEVEEEKEEEKDEEEDEEEQRKLFPPMQVLPLYSMLPTAQQLRSVSWF